MYLAIVIVAALLALGHADRNISLSMPGGRPTRAYSNLCTGFKLDFTEPHYITAFHANLSSNTPDTVHTMLVGCNELGYSDPKNPRAMWDCGWVRESAYPTGPACKNGSVILFGERNNGQSTIFPPGIGLKVGPGTGINSLVFRIHYAKPQMFKVNPDTSGVSIKVVAKSSGKVTKRAGLLSSGPAGTIPAHSKETMDTACRMHENITVYPFMFRTHSHGHGRDTTGWKIDRVTKNWSLLGRNVHGDKSMFYPIRNAKLEQGDWIAARCVMDNQSNENVVIGPTKKDEMCNFFMYYYVNGDQILETKKCWSKGPPVYRWKYDKSLPSLPRQFRN